MRLDTNKFQSYNKTFAKAICFFCIVTLSAIPLLVKSGNPTKWEISSLSDKTFIKNNGQYDGLSLLANDNIKFAVDNPGAKIFFSPTGITWRFDTWKKTASSWVEKQSKGLAPWDTSPTEEDEELEDAERSTSTVHMKWLNASAGAQVVSWEEAPQYYNFSMGNNPVNDINYVKGYRHILYKGLYPGIDVHFSFHPVEGVKYELIMKAGADISQVVMEYTDNQGITLNGADLHIQTQVGDIIDHAPVTFYNDDKSPIASSFLISGNTVTFKLANYDHNREVTVDPWSVSPALVSQNIAFDIEKDGALDVYVHGGLNPYQVRKFNGATGALIWTTNTPNNGQRPGDLATDAAGNSYVTSGHNGGNLVPVITRISPAGVIIWNNNIATTIEFWCLTASAAGAVVVGDSFPGGRMSNIDITNGNRLGTTVVTPASQDNRAQCRNPAGNHFVITTDGGANERVVGVTPAFAIIFNQPAIHNPPYNGTPLYCNGPLPLICGYNGIAANNRYVYTNSGSTLYKRNATTGLLITSIAIPGGVNDANSGVDIDLCGNVYVGSGTGVYQYDSLLNFIAFQATSGAVYDVTYLQTTEVLACGNGFIARQLYAAGCTTVLPVSLTEFKGQKKGLTNELEWTTINEKNHSHFIVERSNDAAAWTELGRVKANGNSNSPRSYSFIDNSPRSEINYYRLKSVATNGSFEYSGIISIESNPKVQQVIIIPNPTSGKFRVRGQDGPVTVFNLLGELIVSSTDDELDLGGYPAGVYLVKCGNGFAKLVLRK